MLRQLREFSACGRAPVPCGDDVSVAKVEIAFDDGPYALASGTTAWTFPVTFAALSGRHLINARATDNLGVTAVTAITVDTVGGDLFPAVAITFPKKNQPLRNPLLVGGTASDPDGTVFKVEITFDSSGVWIPCSSGNGVWSCGSLFPAQFTKGKHNVSARATDNLGAVSTTQVVDFKVL